MSDRTWKHEPLKTPAEAEAVVTVDSNGYPLASDGSALPIARVIEPDNSAGAAGVDLSAMSLPDGAMVLIQDANGATANNITVTAQGSFVDVSGSAVGQLVIDADDGYALVCIAKQLTVILATDGVDLVP